MANLRRKYGEITSQMTCRIMTILGLSLPVEKATNKCWGQVTCLGILDFQRILSRDEPCSGTNVYKSDLLEVNMPLHTVSKLPGAGADGYVRYRKVIKSHPEESFLHLASIHRLLESKLSIC